MHSGAKGGTQPVVHLVPNVLESRRSHTDCMAEVRIPEHAETGNDLGDLSAKSRHDQASLKSRLN